MYVLNILPVDMRGGTPGSTHPQSIDVALFYKALKTNDALIYS